MTFCYACPICESALDLPDSAVGTRVQCPKCELGFVVPEPVRANPAPIADPVPVVVPAPPAASAPPRAPGRFRTVAAALVLVGFGGAGGFFLGRQFPPIEPTVAVGTDEPQPVRPRPGVPVVAAAKIAIAIAPAPRLVVPVKFTAPAPHVVWRPVRLVSATASGGGRIELQPDGSLLVTGPVTDREQYTLVLDTDLPSVGSLQLEALADPSLAGGGPGRAGNFVLNEIRVSAAPAGSTREAAPVPFAGAEATFAQDGCDVEGAIDGALATGWAIAPEVGRSHTAQFRFSAPTTGEKGVRLTVTMDQHYGGSHVLGRFRFRVGP